MKTVQYCWFIHKNCTLLLVCTWKPYSTVGLYMNTVQYVLVHMKTVQYCWFVHKTVQYCWFVHENCTLPLVCTWKLTVLLVWTLTQWSTVLLYINKCTVLFCCTGTLYSTVLLYRNTVLYCFIVLEHCTVLFCCTGTLYCTVML